MNNIVHYYQEGKRFTSLYSNNVFCFGSNTAGIHGAGAALDAKKYFGAVVGVGEGLQGNSYAIPTKDKNLRVLPLDEISKNVARFLTFAKTNYFRNFLISPIGTGLAGYTHADVAVFFKELPVNCCVTESWLDFIPHEECINITVVV